jgi:hypothetical protein
MYNYNKNASGTLFLISEPILGISIQNKLGAIRNQE